MKLFNIASLFLFSLFGAASCADSLDEQWSKPAVGDGETVYSIQMKLPKDNGTRGAASDIVGADGLYSFNRDVDKVWYAVYYNNKLYCHSEQDGVQQCVKSGDSFKLNLTIPEEYDPTKLYVFFWAGNSGDDVKVNAATTTGVNLNLTDRSVSVDQSFINGNGSIAQYDSYSGYFQLSTTSNVSDYSRTFTLKRPFCQVHVLSNGFITRKGDFTNGFTASMGLGKNDVDETNYNSEIYVPTTWKFDGSAEASSGTGLSGFKVNSYQYTNTLSGESPERVTFKGEPMDYVGCFIMFAPQTKQAVKDDSQSSEAAYSKLNMYFRKAGESGAPTEFATVPLPADGMKANERYVLCGNFGEDDSWRWLHVHGIIADEQNPDIDSWNDYPVIKNLTKVGPKEIDFYTKSLTQYLVSGSYLPADFTRAYYKKLTLSGGNIIKHWYHGIGPNYYLTELDVTDLDTSDARSMHNMFEHCESLTSLDLSTLNTSKVEDMEDMFRYCRSLQSITFGNFDTSNDTTMYQMFYECNALKSVDFSRFNTSKVKSMREMFYKCNSLTSLDLSSFDTSKVLDLSLMFDDCESLRSINLSSSFNVSNAKYLQGMFQACISLTSLDLSNFDTSNVVDMRHMFQACKSLTSLDLSNFDTSNVVDMRHMFSSAEKLQSLNISNFNTSKVSNMEDLFSYCYSLKSINLRSFNTSNVTTMNNMFRECKSLTSLDLSSFDTSKVTDMGHMFWGCEFLTSLDLSNFKSDNINNINWMFGDCKNLKSIDLSNLDTSNVTSFNMLFGGCENLEWLDLSKFDASKVTNRGFMFTGCNKIKFIRCKQAFKDWCFSNGIPDNYRNITWEIVP